MRLSVDNGDYGWDVWLDGVKLENVVMADDERGEVRVLVKVGDSWPIPHETLYGKVEIQRSEPKGTPKPANVQGLVAPVWSDAGEVTWEVACKIRDETGQWPRVDGVVTSHTCKWEIGDKYQVVDGWKRQILKPSPDPSHTVTINVTNTKEWKSREEWENILRAWVRKEIVPQALEILPGLIRKASDKPAKAADPNAKPALPALTRVSGNKRGPGWCDE